MGYYGFSAVLVGLLVLGVALAACGGGDGLEEGSSAGVEGTAAASVSGEDSTASGAVRATPVERGSGVSDAGAEGGAGTEASSEGGSGTDSVRATSGVVQPTEEALARVVEEEESEYEIHNIIPRDAIPAILDPEFLDAGMAMEAYNEHEQVLGVSINGDHRAYPIPYLSQHEIVNDVVGGKPVAVTW